MVEPKIPLLKDWGCQRLGLIPPTEVSGQVKSLGDFFLQGLVSECSPWGGLRHPPHTHTHRGMRPFFPNYEGLKHILGT